LIYAEFKGGNFFETQCIFICIRHKHDGNYNTQHTQANKIHVRKMSVKQ